MTWNVMHGDLNVKIDMTKLIASFGNFANAANEWGGLMVTVRWEWRKIVSEATVQNRL